MNGNEIIPKIDEAATAKRKINTPKRNPRTANNIFIAISQANPSKSQLKIKAGKRMERFSFRVGISVV